MRKLFFGWWTVLANLIITTWSNVKSYSFGVYLKPLQDEFGWTRAEASLPASLGSLEGGLITPFSGLLIDKYGPRTIALVGVLISAASLSGMYFVNSLWGFVIIWGLILSIGYTLGSYYTLNAAVTNWFVKKRGLALGISRVGTAFGGALMPPLMTYLLYIYGWRGAFVIAGIVTLMIGVPLVWFFVKPKRPEFYGLMPDGVESSKEKDIKSVLKTGAEYAAKVAEYEFTLRQALSTKTFWFMSISRLFTNFSVPISQVHFIPYLTDIGFNPMSAAAAISILNLVSAPFRIVGGLIADKIQITHLRYYLLAGFAVQDILCWYLMLFPTSIFPSMEMGIYVALVTLGVSRGIITGLEVPVVPRYFGRKAFASIYGIQHTFFLPATLLIPIYVGWAYDMTKSYQSTFWPITVMTVVGLLSLYLAKPPKPPEKITDL